ncbi:hypothetical protein Q5O24_00135 [Eubacteriaceae bacterium ES3]|nr:hypothetical protein Q5O24_00135 [Eubacteriaceae bacterium ES3]
MIKEKFLEYRKLPHGEEKISIIGMGMGSIHESSVQEIEETVRLAIEKGINFFDVVSSTEKPYKAIGRAFSRQREKIYTQMHPGATEAEKDYSIIGEFTPQTSLGNCVYCNHCQPCPQDINVGLINKYYDLAKAGDAIAANHYEKLGRKASDCIQCGHCENRCPFKGKQNGRNCRLFWQISS